MGVRCYHQSMMVNGSGSNDMVAGFCDFNCLVEGGLKAYDREEIVEREAS